MPFIRGHYHINPIAGEALERAREAEAAVLDAGHEASTRSQNEDRDFPGLQRSTGGPFGSKDAIHYIEIERAQLTPPHSGRAESGFVARIHRHGPNQASQSLAGVSEGRTRGTPRSETHVFSRHQDLVNFLSRELEKDCSGD